MTGGSSVIIGGGASDGIPIVEEPELSVIEISGGGIIGTTAGALEVEDDDGLVDD